MSERRTADLLQLALFAALGSFAALHWASLVESPPVGRILLAVAALTAVGAVLQALNRSRLPRPAVHARARWWCSWPARPPRWWSPACRYGCSGRATGTS